MNIYRLILESATLPGRFDTGATYPACSQTNPSGCLPIQFGSLAEAIDYSYAHGEIPYRVDSVAETWAIVEGRETIDPSRIYAENTGTGGGGDGTILGMSSTTVLLLAGAAILLLSSRRQ